MKRRQILFGLSALAVTPVAFHRLLADGQSVTDAQAAGGKIQRIHKSSDEWRRELSDQQFRVLRQAGTERPHSSPLNKEKRAGTFVCAACALPLFKSEWKFMSGTGWPSFYTGMHEHIETKRDFKLVLPRTEYHCARCGGHQGHIFHDGPQPTGERWCNNGVALKFQPA